VKMRRELHAPSHRVSYTRATAGNAPDKKLCPRLLSVGPARISATKVIKCFAHPLLGLVPGAPSRLSCPNADTLVAPGGTRLINRINFPLVHPLPFPHDKPSSTLPRKTRPCILEGGKRLNGVVDHLPAVGDSTRTARCTRSC